MIDFPPTLRWRSFYMYIGTTAQLITPDGPRKEFDVVAGVIQGDTLAPSMLVLSFSLRSFQLLQILSRALFSGDQIDYSCSSEAFQNHQKLNSFTPFQVTLRSPRILSYKSSFIPRTCNLWNVLPSSCFLESYSLPSFKSKTNKLDLIPLSS